MRGGGLPNRNRKEPPSPYDSRPGEYGNFQGSSPYISNKAGGATVAVGATLGAGLLSGGIGLVVKRKARAKAAMAPEGAARGPKVTGADVVFNSGTKGPKRVLSTPRVRSKVPAVYKPDAPIQQVRASVSFPASERRALRNVASDLGRVPRTIFDLNYDPTREDYGRSPASSRGGVPKRKEVRTPRGKVGAPVAPSAPFKSDFKPQARTFDPMVGKAPAPAKPALTQTGYAMKNSLASRFKVSTPTKTPAPKAAAKPKTPKAPKTPTPKAPAATTVEIKAPEMTARAFQPGKLEGETRAQTSARHVAEHAADNAAKRAEKKKVEPKNKTKAPTSAKPPSPAAVEKVSAPKANVPYNGLIGEFETPTPKTSLTAAERKAAKDAKSAENRRVHAENQTREREARRAAKPAGGNAPSPSKPAGPKAPSGGFVSTFKPQVRTFDPMVGQKQYGLKSKPYNDSPEAHQTLVKEGMAGRTGKDQRPTHLYDANGRMVHDVGPFSVEGTKNATSPMFPGGTHDAPTALQPHMTGKGAEIAGTDKAFRVWQGPNRSETVVQHRTGRQINLPFDPKKNKNPVDYKAILDFANKNEKPFLQTTGWDGPRAITQKGSRLSQIGRFSLGAAKAGGILALPLTIAAVGSGADPLSASGVPVDRAGESNTWYAKAHPKKFSADVKSAIKAQSVYQGRRAGSQFKGAASWADIARKYTAGKK